jgi:glycosyltransferase involved in cell wall biosynthesis
MALSTSKKLLWIAPRWPFPPSDGAKRASVELLRPLIAKGVEIHFLGFPVGWETIPLAADRESETLLEKISFSKRFPRRFNKALVQKMVGIASSIFLNREYPYSVQSFLGSEIRSILQTKISETHWDSIVLDGLHVAAPLLELQNGGAGSGRLPLIYRAHNVESKIWEMAASRVPVGLKRVAELQAEKMKRFEIRVLQASSAVAAVSPEDRVELQKFAPHLRSAVIPIGFDFGGVAPLASKVGGLRILFVGKLDWQPNAQGLEWFLDQVWFRFAKLKPEAEFHVVGEGASSSLLKKFRDLNVAYHGRVPDLEVHYRDAKLSIVPVFFGSGTRVKIIESVRFGRPVLSTSMGAQGLELDSSSAYLSDNAEEWLRILVTFENADAENKAQRAFSVFKSRYDSVSVAEKFLELIEEARAQ